MTALFSSPSSSSLENPVFGTLSYKFDTRFVKAEEGATIVKKFEGTNELIKFIWTAIWTQENEIGLSHVFHQKLQASIEVATFTFSGSIRNKGFEFTFKNWSIQNISCYALNLRTTVIIQNTFPWLFLDISLHGNLSNNPLGILIGLSRNEFTSHPNENCKIPTALNQINLRIERVVRELLDCDLPPLITPIRSSDIKTNMIQQITYLGSSVLLKFLLDHLHQKPVITILKNVMIKFPLSLHSLITSYLPIEPNPETIRIVNINSRLPLKVKNDVVCKKRVTTKQWTPLACTVLGVDVQKGFSSSIERVNTLNSQSEREIIVKSLLKVKADPNTLFEDFGTKSTERVMTTLDKKLHKQHFLTDTKERYSNFKRLVSESSTLESDQN